jgi:predicted protein tyrosine phosphatase/2-polyprenyl-3-methyl-5-hydroxy-6-metoxy-1,4-benzoquinol methylase
MPRLHILFICGRNQKRSPTAEKLYQSDPRFSVRSAGTSDSSRRRVQHGDLVWADLILVMERKYTARIEARFPGFENFPPIHSLDIPDDYEFMDQDLLDLLSQNVETVIEAFEAGRGAATNQEMNPFSHALRDYHTGHASAEFMIHRDDGFRQRVPASVFFSQDEFPHLEAHALDLCRGHVLDIGAAAGRHSLQLIDRGLEVTSLDILPETEVILRERGASRIITSDIFALVGERFDTLLMLMNGIGMVGTIEGLDRFLRHAHGIISPGGQIVCDSIDVAITTDPVHRAYRERNVAMGRHPGQQTLTTIYGEITGEPFDWLHIDFKTLAAHCFHTGWHADLIDMEASGHYLCRLTENARPDRRHGEATPAS